MPQHLFIDADDTLWENNIYFEQAIEAFIDFLNHSSLQPHEVRVVLNEIEATQGYGSASFTRSLQETYKRLAEGAIRPEDLEHIMSLGRKIIEHPLELLTGVQSTLAYLAPRHTLILLTKGEQDEQQFKIENSGLGSYFQHTLVVPEKSVATYTQLAQDFQLDATNAWMIGNSPRSDINPALQAGMNAVYIPHPHTWSMEQQAVEYTGSSHLLQLDTFAELCNHF